MPRLKTILLATIIILNGYSYSIKSQEVLTLEECQSKARNNYPLIKRHGLIEKSEEYSLSNAGKGYLPQFSLAAKASYQSDVTEVPVNIPGVNGLSKDQYSATVDVTQTIWDGGAISGKREMSKASAFAEQQQLEVDLYAINDRVNQIYFGILLLDAKLNQNELHQDELQRNYDMISSYIRNGIANQSDLDAVQVEQLKSKQNRAQLKSNRKAFTDMLSILTGYSFSEATILQKPEAGTPLSTVGNNRPELTLFDAQQNSLDIQKKLIKTGYMPKLGLFLTGGYGKPGLNMLEDKFAAYYIGGIRLSWNFGSLYTQKNEKRLIDINKQSLDIQKETFLFNTNLQSTQEMNEIMRNRELLKYDDEIIRLRYNVRTAAEAKVANGTLTVTDLMRELTLEDIAKQDKIQHEIELLHAIYNLKYTTNN